MKSCSEQQEDDPCRMLDRPRFRTAYCTARLLLGIATHFNLHTIWSLNPALTWPLDVHRDQRIRGHCFGFIDRGMPSPAQVGRPIQPDQFNYRPHHVVYRRFWAFDSCFRSGRPHHVYRND